MRNVIASLSPSFFSNESLRRQLVRGGLGTLALNVSAKVLAFAGAILLARMLSPAGYGVYAFAIAVATVLAIPVQLGLPSLVVRMVAVYEQRESWALLRGLLVRANQAVLLVSLLAACIAAAVILLMNELPSRMPKAPLISAFALIPLLALSALRSGTLLGFRRPVLARVPEDLVRPLSLVVLVLALAFSLGPQGVSPNAAIAANVLATALAFFIGTWFLLISTPTAARGEPAVFLGAAWVRDALPFMLASATLIAVRETDVIMLGLLVDAEDVGIYRVASQGATLVVFVSAVVNAVISPHIARLFEQKNHQGLDKLCRTSCRIATIGAAPIIILYSIFGRDVLSVVFGPEYEEGFVPLLILSCGYLIYAVMGPVGPLLSMTGHAWNATVGVSVAAVANIILNLALIPPYGATGAAVASVLAILLMHVVLGYYAYARVGIIIPTFKHG